MVPQAPVSVVVVAFDGPERARFVMVRHARRGWELPGGTVEAGEGPIDAARREFEEETGRELLDAQGVTTVETENSRYRLVTGFAGPRSGTHEVHGPIEEHRFVALLSDVAPLAFPDDPYERIGEALGRPLL